MRTLVLDIGGVFYRDGPDAAFWPRWSAKTGLDAAAIEAFLTVAPERSLAVLGKITPQDCYRQAAERLGVAADVLTALTEEAYLSEFDQPLADFVRGLRGRGVPVSALTNSIYPEADIRARPGLEDLFDHVVSSYDVGAAKPDPAIFEALLARLGVGRDAIVFADDRPVIVEASRAFGIETIHVTSSQQLIADLERRFPYASISSRR
jgi:HAD superfamily hydrolase (TIGR01509 family)